MGEGERLVIKCGVIIRINGRFSRPYCYNDIGDVGYSREVSRIVRRATRNIRLDPPRVDSRRVSVWFNFAIIFTQEGGQQTIQVVENHLLNEAEYGLNYIAAQRWDFGNLNCDLLPNKRFSVTAFVAETGELTGFGETESSSFDYCVRMLQRDMRRSQFIPATVAGLPVPSTYEELFGDFQY